MGQREHHPCKNLKASSKLGRFWGTGRRSSCISFGTARPGSDLGPDDGWDLAPSAKCMGQCRHVLNEVLEIDLPCGEARVLNNGHEQMCAYEEHKRLSVATQLDHDDEVSRRVVENVFASVRGC